MGDPNNQPGHEDPEDTGSERPGSSERADTGLLNGRMVAALAAVAIGIIAAVVIVSISADDDSEVAGTSDASDAVDITAVPGSVEPEDDPTATSQVEPDPESLEATSEGEFEVDVSRGDEALFELAVHDPETPTSPGSPARHCVNIQLVGPTSVEAYGCAAVGGTTAAEPSALQLSTPGEPLIGCASVATRDTPGDPGALDAASAFAIHEGSALPAGDYQVAVTTISGSGDGCEPADQPLERSTLSTFEITLD